MRQFFSSNGVAQNIKKKIRGQQRAADLEPLTYDKSTKKYLPRRSGQAITDQRRRKVSLDIRVSGPNYTPT